MHIYTVTCIIHTTVQLLVLKLRLISPGSWYTELHHGTRGGKGGGVGEGRWILSLPIIEATACPKQSHGAIRHKADPVSRVTLEWLIAHVWYNKILKWLRGLATKLQVFHTLGAVFLFSQSVERKARHTKMTTHIAEGARRERLLGLPPSFLAPRGLAARHSRTRAIPSLNLNTKESLKLLAV